MHRAPLRTDLQPHHRSDHVRCHGIFDAVQLLLGTNPVEMPEPLASLILELVGTRQGCAVVGTPTTTPCHFDAMLDRLGGYTRTIIVVSETPFGPVEDPSIVATMNTELARYNEAARAAAAVHGELFLDVWAPFAAARHLTPADGDDPACGATGYT